LAETGVLERIWYLFVQPLISYLCVSSFLQAEMSLISQPNRELTGEPGFEGHLRVVTQSIRGVLAEVMTSVHADASKPQAVAKQLGLDKNLSWKLAKVINEDDLLAVAAHLPGRTGLNIAIKSFQKAGASPESLQRLQAAIANFDRMVQVHCGDRNTLEIMLGHLQRDNGPRSEEASRKKAFQGNSAIWGVQVRVRFTANFVSPAADDLLDLTVVSGWIDFRRLRSQVPWAMASVTRCDDQGNPIPDQRFEPIDPSVGREDAPIIREFCSDPPPKLRTTQGLPGVIRHELVGGPVGNTAACTCVVGWIRRADCVRHRTDQERFLEHVVTHNTPAELSIHDFFVHRELSAEVHPTVHLYSQLPGGPVYPQCGREQGELPLREDLINLGGWPPDVVTPEVPNYAKLVALAASRIGWTLNDFVGYRMKLRYPPIPTALLFRHELARKK